MVSIEYVQLSTLPTVVSQGRELQEVNRDQIEVMDSIFTKK